jgi:hypothetical protein
VGKDAVEARELHGDHLGVRLGGDEPRREKLAAEREHVGKRRVHARAGMSLGVEREPERLDDRGAHILGEGHLRAPRHVVAEHAEPLVGVDPATSRLRNRRSSVEGEARGVREEVAYGRAGRPRGLVEVEHPFLRRDEDGERGDELRHGRESDRPGRVPARRDDVRGARHPRGGEGDVPAVDLVQGVH